MAKRFNITGSCDRNKHYMVDIEERLQEIRDLVDQGAYFSMNRGRQYGKTTTLNQLREYLCGEYLVASLDFQFLTQEDFRTEYAFAAAFANRFVKAVQQEQEMQEGLTDALKKCAKERDCSLSVLFEELSEFCRNAPKPVILMIDEVDSASNNEVFVDFLALLRGYYLHRTEEAIFQSVILAGVYDIKRLRQKIRGEGEHKTNSPWNIAADFDVDMDLHVSGIREMLLAYERDYHTGMNPDEMSELIYAYTSGYPFLVSRICKLLDEKIAGTSEFPTRAGAWTKEGFLAAEKMLLVEKNTLFESLIHRLEEYSYLREMIYSLLFEGARITYNPYHFVIDMASMFGFVKNENGAMVIANRIFEVLLYNWFLSEEEVNSRIFSEGTMDKNQFVQDGFLNMDMVLKRFMVHWGELYGGADEKFLEDNGRKLFLLYLKPIINGVGNYYIEARTRDGGRTDVIVDYRGRQYIIELKIWRGNAYNDRGERQLAEYLDAYQIKEGYMVSFNFNKNKTVGAKEIMMDGRRILEVVV